jgi:hypothetical protein
MLSVVMLNVVMLSAVRLNVTKLSAVRLNIIMLSVVMLNVIMLSVVAPFICRRRATKKFCSRGSWIDETSKLLVSW